MAGNSNSLCEGLNDGVDLALVLVDPLA